MTESSKARRRLRGRWELGARWLLALASVGLVLALGEGMARTVLVQSDSFNFTLSAQRWFDRHWGPENRFGMRDDEVDRQRLVETKRVFVVGDSFAAGHGIENREDRFANRIRAGLGSEWSTVLLARNGWNSYQQLQALEKFPLDPHVIVLAYYPNDIEGAGLEHGRAFEVSLDVPGPIAPLVEHSFLVNLVYWRLRRVALSGEVQSYRAFTAGSFADDRIWGRHREQLLDFVEFANQRRARLVVVAIPDLTDVEASMGVMERPIVTFREAGVEVVDLGAELAGRPAAELIVSAVDGHANVEVHGIIADLVLEILRRDPLPALR